MNHNDQTPTRNIRIPVELRHMSSDPTPEELAELTSLLKNVREYTYMMDGLEP
jgi:hypothetical protein